MRRLSLLLSLAVFSLPVMPILAQQSDIASARVNCPDGTEITNGAEIKVNMRPGFTYTATALGIGDFDPVIAISDDNGVQFCEDDTPSAADENVDLPTTERVSGTSSSASVPFSHNFNDFADISIIVGDIDGATGEFVLILEGMAVTNADGDGDGAGDPFSAHLTQNMVNSGVPLAVYMLAVRNDLDPFMQFVDSDRKVITLDDGTRVQCDDSSNEDLCWGESSDLSDSNIGRTPGAPTDSMISIVLDGFPLESDPELNYFNYLMTSYEQASTGDYLVAFHVGIGDAEVGSDNGNGNNGGGIVVPTPSATDKGSSLRVGGSGGIELTCADGTEINNGVEVAVNLPRGVTYTVTALGVGDFDPIIAVRDPNGRINCVDDAQGAIRYTANLPTTGFIRNADTNAQIEFSQDSDSFGSVSIIVGGFDGMDGEFALVIEGGDIADDDGTGDPYAVRVSPNMIESGVPLTLYMLGAGADLDPFLQLVDPDGERVFLDDDPIECDDSGDEDSCFGGSRSLVGAFVTGGRNNQINGRDNSAMLSLPIEEFDPNVDTDLSFLNFRMTSYAQASTGDYVMVFHVGIGGETFEDTESNI
jgi:hypothetical protein